MNQLMLRALSPVLTTASILLISVAITMADGGNSWCAPPVCPAEPPCVGTCSKQGQSCTDVTQVNPDKSEQPACACLPPPPPPQ